MKNFLFIKIFFLFASVFAIGTQHLSAEIVTCGTGTSISSTQVPIYGFYGYTDGNYLVTTSDMLNAGGAPGLITHIGMQFSTFNEISPIMTEFKIQLANSTINVFNPTTTTPTSPGTPFQIVYSRANVSFASFYAEQHGSSGNYSNNS